MIRVSKYTAHILWFTSQVYGMHCVIYDLESIDKTFLFTEWTPQFPLVIDYGRFGNDPLVMVKIWSLSVMINGKFEKGKFGNGQRS